MIRSMPWKMDKMVMQTDLNMNGHSIINHHVKSNFVMPSVFHSTKNSTFALFGGDDKVVIPVKCRIIKVRLQIIDDEKITPIFLTINNHVGRGTNAKNQTYNFDVPLLEGHLFEVRVQDSQGGVPPIKCRISLLFETL